MYAVRSNIFYVVNRMEALYQNRGYFELYGKDVVISLGIGAVTLGIVSYSTYQSLLLQIRANWNE